MRVFLSHCDHDTSHVRRVMDALVRAGVEVCDGGRDRDLGAHEIERALLACEHVVVVASRTTPADPRVAHDLALALRQGFGSGRLSVIELPDDPDRVDAIAAELIAAISSPLVSRAGPLRLAIVERTMRELEADAAFTRDVPGAGIDEPVRRLAAADARYRDGDVRAAAVLLEDALTCLATCWPGFRPYFLRIAQAVCDLRQGFDPTSRLRAVEDHPLRDESWFAIDGIVALRAGRRNEARVRFRTALAESRARGARGLDVFAHVYPSDDEDVLLPGPSSDGRADESMRCVRAARSLARGLPELAAAELQRLPITRHDDTSIQLLAHALIELDSWSAAIAQLEMYLVQTAVEPSASVMRTLAGCYTAIGAVDRAAEVRRSGCEVRTP